MALKQVAKPEWTLEYKYFPTDLGYWLRLTIHVFGLRLRYEFGLENCFNKKKKGKSRTACPIPP